MIKLLSQTILNTSFYTTLKINAWWQPKLAFLLALAYLCFFNADTEMFSVFYFLILFSFSALGFGILGHVINDVADANHDLKNKKKNILNSLSKKNVLLISLGCLLMAYVPWCFLKVDFVIAVLLITELLLFVLYAIKPFRLKEYRFTGVIVDAMYAYALPGILIVYATNLFFNKPIDIILLVLLFLWALLIGIQNIVIHQIEDYDNDINSKTLTWAVYIGKKYARKILFSFILPFHVLLFVLFSLFVEVFYFKLFLLFPLLYLFFKGYNIFKWKPYKYFLNSNLSADLQKLNIHYHYFLPYWHLTLLSIIYVKFLALFALHLLIFNYSFFKWFFQKFLYSYLFSFVRFIFYDCFYKVPSKVINYTFFYFRVYVLRESEEKARREYQAQHERNKADDDERKARENEKLNATNIVLANVNLNKYTETFVEKHFKDLSAAGYHVHRYYGGYLPTASENNGSFLPDNPAVKYFYKWKESFFDLEKDYHLKTEIKKHLLANNIQIVIAEFGIVGTHLAPICKEVNIPLIVIFHGYDAHNNSFLNSYSHAYNSLFAYASIIIGVSKDLISKLKLLGASNDKLYYLPCGIDIDRFFYTNHSNNLPIFLSVGRFAETKSPHLTIFAFNEVLKEIPNARLRMIGKDGGGELFEACHILVKALKIEDKVDFLGIQPPDVVYEEMKNARVFVQHSVTTPLNGDKEGTPVSVMEAMACGLPIVATNHAGIAELIVNNESGILVEEFDYLSMAAAMIKMCKNDDLVYRLGKNASESIRNQFFIKNGSEVLAELIEKHRLK